MSEIIKDSGDRREFSTGSRRDMASKGRCDLLPWDMIAHLYYPESPEQRICYGLERAMRPAKDGTKEHGLWDALMSAIELFFDGSTETMLLELAFHYEAGCKKYGDDNWRLGQPLRVYVDSAGRHFLKHMRGDTDERHDRACVWNLLCALWTFNNLPEMVDAGYDI